MSTTPSYISSMFAKVASTAQESPVSPLPGQEDQSARLAASAEVGQVEGTRPDSGLLHAAKRIDRFFGPECTNRCSHCGNGLLEEFCHEPPFVRFSCTDCGCGMDKNLNVISQPRVIDVGISEVPENAIVTGFAEQDDGFKYPFGFVRGEGYFLCDRFGWAMWPDLEGMLRALALRMLEQGA